MIPQRECEKQEEQAIMLSLLSVPEFRKRAGLPPREYGQGEKLEVIAALLGISKGRVVQIQNCALEKCRRAFQLTNTHRP